MLSSYALLTSVAGRASEMTLPARAVALFCRALICGLPRRHVPGHARTMSDKNFQFAAPLDSVPEGSVHKVELGGLSILLCHTKGQVFAVRNLCSHAEEELACGRMKSGWIACPAHGARFRLETGEPMNPPATEPIQTFETRIVDGNVEVLI